MSRKKGSDGKRSRAKILAIAADEFACNGYHGTKISDIVANADLTQPTFYLYFSNKEAIFNELVEQFRSDLRQIIKGSRLESGRGEINLFQRIQPQLEKLFRFFYENPSSTRIGLYLSEESAKIKDDLASAIKENLLFEQQEGYFRADLGMDIAAECLVGIIERLTLSKLLTGKQSPEKLSALVVDLLLRGMLKKMGLEASYS